MSKKNIKQLGMMTTTSIVAAWFLVTNFGMIQKIETAINFCLDMNGAEYIVVAAFLGLLPAFFKAVHDDTHNRGAMKLS